VKLVVGTMSTIGKWSSAETGCTSPSTNAGNKVNVAIR
jgi:hypothetical protein